MREARRVKVALAAGLIALSAPARGTDLTLVKEVINDNGGAAVAAQWTLAASGPSGFSGPGPAVSNEGELTPGTYHLSESGGPEGYAASDWDCVGGTQNDADTVTVAVDESVTCTITNDDKLSQLTLVKQVVNDDGGTAEAADWILTAEGPTPFSGPGPTVSGGGEDFEACTYTLSEDGPGGYSASTWVCEGGNQVDEDTVTFGPGETVTCTIINDDVGEGEVLFVNGFEATGN
jgi:hypothetical protein